MPSQPIGPPQAVQEREVDGCLSLYDPTTHQVAVLNQTASDIWRLIDGHHSIEEIVDLLAEAYETDPDQIRHEVERTVETLVERGFLPGR